MMQASRSLLSYRANILRPLAGVAAPHAEQPRPPRSSQSGARKRSLATASDMRRSKFRETMDGTLQLQLDGQVIRNPVITWEQWGDPSLPAERTVFVFPGMSNSSHAARNLDDPRPGWWNNIIGPNKHIDTTHFRVICPATLGAPFGTASPIETNPETGKPYMASFPQITPGDIAACHAMLMDHLGLQKVHAVVGASLGGMAALQFASLFPERLERLIVISCTAKSTPGSCALRRVQRRAILGDTDYKDGFYDLHHHPTRGLAIARELALATYMSRHEFDTSFDWEIMGEAVDFDELTFEVENYLHNEATKFAKMYDPNCYILLLRAADLQDMGTGRKGGLREGMSTIQARTLILGVNKDEFIPRTEQKFLFDTLASHNSNVELDLFEVEYGHHAVFKPRLQDKLFGPRIKIFLEDGLQDELAKEKFRYSSL